MASRAESKRQIVSALIANPNRSDRSVAAELGSTQPRVLRIRHELEGQGSIPVFRGSPGPKPRSQPGSVVLEVTGGDLLEVQSVILAAAKRGDLRAALYVMQHMAASVPVVVEEPEPEPKLGLFDELASRRAV